MSFGSVLSNALQSAGEAGTAAAQAVVRSSVNTLTAVADLAQRTGKAAVSVADAVVDGAAYVGRKVVAAEVVGVSALTGVGVGVVAGATVAAIYAASAVRDKASSLAGMAKHGFDVVQEQFSGKRPVESPCLPCQVTGSAEARKKRIEKRNALIADSRASNDPEMQMAAGQLKEDMKAVELAMLSDNTYAQYAPDRTPESKKPPEPWEAMTPDSMSAVDIGKEFPGVNIDDLREAKAVIYRIPPDSPFPFDPKVVLAFRGTDGPADYLEDHDQALDLNAEQYVAARALGKAISGTHPDAEVTGHSLGGGKAQAAGVAGGLRGQMFNSAGLHPRTVGMTPEQLAPYAGNFKQYRAEGGILAGGGDPLTGLQNSPRAQRVAFGITAGLQATGRANAWALKELGVSEPLNALPESSQPFAHDLAQRILNVTPQQAAKNYEFSKGQWFVPPALGEVRGVTSKDGNGKPTLLLSQHSMPNLVFGLEDRKAQNIETLLESSGREGTVQDYMAGPSNSW